MGETVWVPIVVALISAGVVTGLAKALWDWITGKHRDEDNAWKQRDSHRRRADQLHKALLEHQTWCHIKHGAAFKEMPSYGVLHQSDNN
ncbi:hypothetical protein [Nesterenkonia rhizosphaerae]|uniref:Uncharacterized protein n=1 Tax=Nesterenkonia rhizosphaerae TaxID=1348272 RepID=A0ABP9FZP5_9MICC